MTRLDRAGRHRRPTLRRIIMRTIQSITDDFAFLDDWEDRYRYIIELGRELDALPEAMHTESRRVKGCASQVWLDTQVEDSAGVPTLIFRGDSDAHIVKGLIAVTLALFSGRTAPE